MPHQRLNRVLAALAAAYLAAVGLYAILGPDALWRPREVASSPATLGDGELQRLLSSALAVAHEVPLIQVVLLALVAALVIRRHGALAWWGAVLAAQVLSALLTYAVIALFEAFGSGSAERASDDLDYGISILVTGSLGALFAGALLRVRAGSTDPRERIILVASLLSGLATIPFSFNWYGIEHPLGFVLGAAFLIWWERARSHRPAAE